MANEVKLEDACQQILGISSRRYRQLAHEGVVPPVVKGRINILQSCKYMLEYYRKLASSQGSMSLTDERVRITRLNADLRELELKTALGEIINTDRAMRIWGQTIQIIRQKLLAIPTKLPPLIMGIKSLPQIKNKVDNFIREILNELVNIELGNVTARENASRKRIQNRDRQGMGCNKDNTRAVQASAQVKRKRMGRRKKSTKSRVVRRAGKILQ